MLAFPSQHEFLRVRFGCLEETEARVSHDPNSRMMYVKFAGKRKGYSYITSARS
jgi:hypothetical protein